MINSQNLFSLICHAKNWAALAAIGPGDRIEIDKYEERYTVRIALRAENSYLGSWGVACARSFNKRYWGSIADGTRTAEWLRTFRKQTMVDIKSLEESYCLTPVTKQEWISHVKNIIATMQGAIWGLKNLQATYLGSDFTLALEAEKSIDKVIADEVDLSMREIHYLNKMIDKAAGVARYNPLKIKTMGSAVSTTYHPQGSTLEEDRKGILDFARVFPELGSAYVADGTSHGKPEKYSLLSSVWNEFNETFKLQLQVKDRFDSKEDLKKFMQSTLTQLGKNFEKIAYDSTFSLSILLNFEDKKYAAFIHVGDSVLLCMNKEGEIEYLTPSPYTDKRKECFQSGLAIPSSIHFGIKEVQAGDKIYGFTDGVADFLPEDILSKILVDGKTTAQNTLERLEIGMRELDQTMYPNIKKLNPEDPHQSDDLGFFMMLVP